ncbi:MAG: carbamoyl phosphate synthase large subunit, partial [Desulfobacterium sp.]|nr:carbamoyl phosphate synthase large subunit [Desulfobacterium sp.]MBU4036776.1 carbamoyl phosphate synthase large subunit [Pseudomonadota bacterium]
GEVMGIDSSFGLAFAKAQLGAGQKIPTSGNVFISVMDSDKKSVIPVASKFYDMGFNIIATKGTSAFLAEHNIPNEPINKVSMGRPHVVDAIKNKSLHLIINTGTGAEPMRDGYEIRRAAIKYNIPCITTIPGALAICRGIEELKGKKLSVKALQDYY